MTKASTGLATALARTASGTVIALAELSADDALAGLSDETKAQLGAKLNAGPAPAGSAAAATAEMEPDDSDDMCSKCETAKKDGKCKCETGTAEASATDAAAAAASAQPADASAHDRVKAVAASDAAKANPGAALAILADDDYAKLSADAVIKLVGQVSPVAAGASEDDVGRQMLANMAGNNPDLGAGDTSPAQEANHGWDDIHADIAERRGARR